MIKNYSLLLIPLLLTSLSDSAFAMQKVYVNKSYTTASSGIHTYGIDAFDTLSMAIEAVSPNGIIYIANGIYPENLIIEKSLTLRGEGSLPLYGAKIAAPTIDGGSGLTPAVITIQASTSPIVVNIRNLNIIHGGNGINVLQNALVTIQNNTVTGYRKNGITFGPVLYSGYGGVSGRISNNIIVGSGPTNISSQNGIQISENNTATITDNKISNHIYAIPDSWWASGILIHQSNNVFTSHNLLYNNQAGIDIMQGSHNKVIKNSIYGNEETKAGITLSGSSKENAQPTAANIIENNTITGGAVGIWASNTNSNIYLNNKISSSTETGIYSWNGIKNTLSKNIISQIRSKTNNALAILIDGEPSNSSTDNILSYNIIYRSDFGISVGKNSLNDKLTSNTEMDQVKNVYTEVIPKITIVDEHVESRSAGMVLGVSTFNFTKNLMLGTHDIDVTQLQKILVKEGFLQENITGYFDSATKNALIKWQKINNLAATGVFEQDSRNILNTK